MLITLMFSLVAKKSRTWNFQFLIFSWWGGVQELGGSTARQIAKLASGNSAYHRLSLWMGAGCGTTGFLLFSFPWVRILSCLGVWIFPGVWSFSGVLWNPQIRDSQVQWSLLRVWSRISHWVVRKLYIVCFAYSLLSLVCPLLFY